MKRINQIRWVRLTLQVVVISFCVVYLVLNLKNASIVFTGLKINYYTIAASVVLTICSVFFGALGWWIILRAIGQTVNYAQTMHTHLVSNLMKYLPGFAWQLFGKAYLTREMGLSAYAIGLGMVLELGQLVFIGFLLAVSLIPDIFLTRWLGVEHPDKLLLLIRIITLALYLISPLVASTVLKKRFFPQDQTLVVPKALWASSMVYLMSWITLGLAYWLLATSLTPLPYSTIPPLIFTLATSLIVGLAIIFIPGSIGVRESIMVFLLSPLYLSAPVAVLVATLSRLAVILSELLCTLTIVIIIRHPSKNSIREPLIRN